MQEKIEKEHLIVTSKLLHLFLVVINSCAHTILYYIPGYMVKFSVSKIVSRLYDRIKYINISVL